MTIAYIALGSNQASPLEQVNAALKAIAGIPDSRIVAVSSFLPHAAAWPTESARLFKCRRRTGYGAYRRRLAESYPAY
ncbi:2-amino-4-hydroxy-6-hydroxymethyldihyropteridine pyrophosphokinase [Salmonella enterica subsp. arizonae]|uniref:2-amino-4-hydroxy-6-hydroxymethyldihyropteridine pyrophosphokinase n=1 Tax=Salmonella enterica subsp. arizonae TaxID=59203 RepID=A0A379TGY6_SALER|nr:2-amino-4-hydroxy-6-hydroxymethyldihyropteridine pyrophosphokinase [Salmonella enterica subsp. arizonae]